MGFEINNAVCKAGDLYEKKLLLFKPDSEKISILDLNSEDKQEFYTDKADIGDKETDAKADSTKQTKEPENVKEDEKLKEIEKTDKLEEVETVKKEELNKNLIKYAESLNMDEKEAKEWADMVLEKAQKVYDNVYEDCINKLGKTEERAKLVANIAYQFTVDTLVKQAEKDAKEKQGTFV